MDAKIFDAKLKASRSRDEKIALLDAQAEELFEKGNYDEAGKYFEQALRLEKKTNVRAYYSGRVGICHYNTGRDREAQHYLLKSIHLFEPDQPEFMADMYGFVHFHLGSLFEYLGKAAKSLEARRVCEQYLESQEKDTRWMLYAGMSRNYEALGQHDLAIQYSQKAIQVLSDNDPSLAYLYESMGNNYLGLKQYSDAIKAFSKVLELDPRFVRREDIYLKLAECYQKQTNNKLALETYQKMLEVKQLTGKRESLTWLYLKIALCHFLLEQYEKSLIVTLEALRRQPRGREERAQVRGFLTNNYHELGRYRDAVTEGEKTLKLAKRFPNDNLFYVRMALSYHKLSDKKAFARYRKLFRRLFPEDSWNSYLEKLG